MKVFAPYAEIIEIRSAIPVERNITLAIATAETTVVVSESGTLIDPHATGSSGHLGSETIRDRAGASPGRSSRTW